MAVTCRSWLSDTPAQQITPTLVAASMGNALHLETLLDKGRTRSELRLQVHPAIFTCSVDTSSTQINHFCSKHDLFEGGHSTAMLLRETRLNRLGRNQLVAAREVTPVQADQPTCALSPHRSIVRHPEWFMAPSAARGGTGRLPPAVRLATTAASAQGSGKGVGEACWSVTVACAKTAIPVCIMIWQRSWTSSPCCRRGGTIGDSYHPQQPPFIVAQLWAFLACPGEKKLPLPGGR